MFAGMLFFVCVQLFCFYKKGMVFSPWYNYGMYSEVMNPKEVYTVTKVYADSQLLKGNNFSPQAWDRIHYNLHLATAAACNDHFYEKEIKRIAQKFHVPTPGKWNYVNHKYESSQIFQFNKRILSQRLNHNNIEVYPLEYSWNGKSLVFKDSLYILPASYFLCQ
jgi:hypothetical protein